MAVSIYATQRLGNIAPKKRRGGDEPLAILCSSRPARESTLTFRAESDVYHLRQPTELMKVRSMKKHQSSRFEAIFTRALEFVFGFFFIFMHSQALFVCRAKQWGPSPDPRRLSSTPNFYRRRPASKTLPQKRIVSRDPDIDEIDARLEALQQYMKEIEK